MSGGSTEKQQNIPFSKITEPEKEKTGHAPMGYARWNSTDRWGRTDTGLGRVRLRRLVGMLWQGVRQGGTPPKELTDATRGQIGDDLVLMNDKS